MPTDGLSKVFEHLRQTLRLPDEELLTDSELLTRFINSRDQAAFAALFRRHSRMVLTVCRRVLGHAHDAEDALQATFLVLARKAKRVVKHEALGSYLYKVAYRTALEAKNLNDKRKQREKLMDSVPPIALPAAEIQDWRDVLYRELNRLPEKYREPIVLCDLEGQSRKRVANQLKLPEGTLSSRLAKARTMLAQRLSRRGVVLSAGALATALAQEVAAAPLIPASLAASTTKAALLVAAGKAAAVSIPAVVLMKGVLKAMLLTKLKIAAGLLLVMGVLGASGFAYRSGSTLQAEPPENEILKELKDLRKEMELLKANMQMFMEKVRTQETKINQLESRAIAGPGVIAKPAAAGDVRIYGKSDGSRRIIQYERSDGSRGIIEQDGGRKIIQHYEPAAAQIQPTQLNALQHYEPAAAQIQLNALQHYEPAAAQIQLNALQRQHAAEIETLRKKLADKEVQAQLTQLQLNALRAQHAAEEKALCDKHRDIENAALAQLKVYVAERREERTVAEMQLRVAESKMRMIAQMIDHIEREIQEALKALERASDKETKQRAQKMLDQALQKLKELSKLRESGVWRSK